MVLHTPQSFRTLSSPSDAVECDTQGKFGQLYSQYFFCRDLELKNSFWYEFLAKRHNEIESFRKTNIHLQGLIKLLWTFLLVIFSSGHPNKTFHMNKKSIYFYLRHFSCNLRSPYLRHRLELCRLSRSDELPFQDVTKFSDRREIILQLPFLSVNVLFHQSLCWELVLL